MVGEAVECLVVEWGKELGQGLDGYVGSREDVLFFFNIFLIFKNQSNIYFFYKCLYMQKTRKIRRQNS